MNALSNRLDQNEIQTGGGDILVFCVLRNEAKRLPFWLEYYRGLGVAKFFVIDNGSTDGSVDILLKQGDCIVFQTLESYAGSRCGVDWLNLMLDLYGAGHWCLVPDVDELFVFSTSFGKSLRDLTQAADREEAEAVLTLMVDMYAPGSLKDVSYESGTPFWTQCNSFDTGPYSVVAVQECPYVNILGGVRQRLFYPEYARRSLVDRLGWKIGNLLSGTPWLKARPFVKKIRFTLPPVVSKVPLIKWKKGAAYISGAHTVTPFKIFHARCALLHFKFFNDFHDRAIEEIRRGQHYDGAREYRRYFSFFSRNPDFSLAGPQTASYSGPESLEHAGLIQGREPGIRPDRF